MVRHPGCVNEDSLVVSSGTRYLLRTGYSPLIRRYIPIRLMTGVERNRVMDEAVAQMARIADSLLETFPNN